MKNLLIVDLEATCFSRGDEPADFQSEIIEIGAVRFNTKARQVTQELQLFIRPLLFSALSLYCTQLTGIRQSAVDDGLPLDQALSQLAALYAPTDIVFSSWGFYDQRQIERESAQRGIPYPFNKEHISLKHNHAKLYSLTHPLGMDAALAYHHLPLVGHHHRALDDARNIAAITARMLDDGWTHRYLIA